MGYVMYLKMYIMCFWSVVYILFSHFGEERITHEDILVKGLMDRPVYNALIIYLYIWLRFRI